jgi:DNA replication and repair protein RecF
VKVERVHISSFKNIKPLTLDLGEGVNGFWGENGQGKSNFLEAIHVAIKGESFRPYSQRQDWFPIDDGQATENLRIELLCRDDQGLEYQCQMLHGYSSSKWHWSLNGKKQKAYILAQKIPLVVFSPDDHSLIRESPEVRRSFLDTVLVDVVPGYAEVKDRFEKSLKNRNKLLKHMVKSEVFEYTAELDSWTHALATEAEGVALLRREVWPRFSEYFQSVVAPLFETLQAPVSLHYERDAILWKEDFNKSKYYQILKDEFRKDLATGWTHRGPHRDDFRIELAGLDARTKASQGQARLLALSLKWTHALWVSSERREIPLFLIDDFSNELDILRRKKLLELLGQISGQILITGTDSNTAKTGDFSKSRNFTVRQGEILPAK